MWAKKKKINEEFWLEILFGSIASISSVDHMRHISITHTTQARTKTNVTKQ